MFGKGLYICHEMKTVSTDPNPLITIHIEANDASDLAEFLESKALVCEREAAEAAAPFFAKAKRYRDMIKNLPKTELKSISLLDRIDWAMDDIERPANVGEITDIIIKKSPPEVFTDLRKLRSTVSAYLGQYSSPANVFNNTRYFRLGESGGYQFGLAKWLNGSH